MRQDLVRTLRFRALEPARLLVGRALRVEAPIRSLVASDGLVYTSEQQVAPMHAHRALLRRKLGVVFGHMLVGDALSLPPRLLPQCDVIFLKLGFRTPGDVAVDAVRRMRELASPEVRLVYLDGDDDLCVQWPEMLPWLDLYVKKHVFANRREYTRPRIGKSNLTDYVARTYGTSFADDPIPGVRGVPEEQLSKIALGWNVGVDDRIVRQFRERGARAMHDAKDVDVICRAAVKPGDWIRPLRRGVIPALRRLSADYDVLLPDKRVPQDEYHREMQRSRVCVSPFGYGEICWRDFEAVLSGCLLVKPDVGHLRTEPDIFVPHETYVPVRWDFADLEGVLRYYLERPDRARSIARRAHEVLTRYYRGDGFARSFSRVLRAAGVRRAT